MTGEQIIKNLKEITDNKIIRNTTCIISLSFLGEILDFINRQKAEIGRVTEKYNCQQTVYADLSKIINEQAKELKQAKSEAIKTFAERLKLKIWYSGWCNFERTITPEIITDLVKEMTEVQE